MAISDDNIYVVIFQLPVQTILLIDCVYTPTNEI